MPLTEIWGAFQLVNYGMYPTDYGSYVEMKIQCSEPPEVIFRDDLGSNDREMIAKRGGSSSPFGNQQNNRQKRRARIGRTFGRGP